MTTWIIVGAVVIGVILIAWILNAWRLAARNRNVARRQPTMGERQQQMHARQEPDDRG